MTIFEYQRVSTIYCVLCRFTESATGIHITADRTGTLLSQQRFQIRMLANQLVASREVQYDVGTSQCQIVAWWYGGPHILADLRTKLHTVGSHEYLRLWGDVHRTASEIDIRRIQVLCRGKPSLLVKLAVVGQIRLRHDA